MKPLMRIGKYYFATLLLLGTNEVQNIGTYFDSKFQGGGVNISTATLQNN